MENIRLAVEAEVVAHVFDTSTHRPVGSAGQWNIHNVTLGASLIPRFRRAVRSLAPDVVHIETGGYLGPLKSALLAMSAGQTPTVLSLHSPHIEADLAAAGRLGRKAVLCGFSRAAVIRVEHGGQKREIRALHPKLASAVIEVIPNLVEVDAVPVVDHAQLRTDQFTLVCVGSVGERKGTYDLIRAIALVSTSRPQIKCRIMGPEERPGDIRKLQQLIDRLHLAAHVSLEGPTPRTNVLQVLARAHAFTLPAYAEGLPLAVLEAMAAGLPVLVTDVGGMSDVVHQEIGFVSPGNADQLAEAIITLIDDPPLSARVGRANREYVCTALAPRALGAAFIRLWGRAAAGTHT